MDKVRVVKDNKVKQIRWVNCGIYENNWIRCCHEATQHQIVDHKTEYDGKVKQIEVNSTGNKLDNVEIESETETDSIYGG